MSAYCYVGSAEAVCELNIGPYCIELDCLPDGAAAPCGPDVVLGNLRDFHFTPYEGGEPGDHWIAVNSGTSGADILDGNGLLAGMEAWSGGAVAQAGNGTYLGQNVYFHIGGGDGDDQITGGANADMLYGGYDNDVLHGLGGSDQVYGDSGSDQAYGGDGNDWVDGSSGDDMVNGDAGNDNVAGGTESDVVNGGDGDDNLFGDLDGQCGPIESMIVVEGNFYAPETFYDGSDLMDGGAGNDMMFGQGGNDTMLGGIGDDGMDGGSGNDSISAGDGIDNVTGGSGDDTIMGDAGNDLINAGDGDDRVYGGTGNDWIAGGMGDDVMTGGAGKDHFVFCDDSCSGDDYITDFTTVRARDQIDLTQLFNLDLVISSETGTRNDAFLELISFGADGEMGGGDDYSLGTIDLHSKQNIARVFDLDSTFGTSSNALVRVAAGVLIDMPSDSFVYDGIWA